MGSYSKSDYNRGNFKNKGSYKGNDTSGYIGAPYNFVPMAEKVVEYSREQLPAHNSVDPELISGEISYEITAETPIIIDDGKGNFYKDPYDRYAIPGSSVRGLVRSNAQILSFSSLNQDVDDYRLMYRKVAGKGGDSLKDRYSAILGAKTVKINNNQFSVLENVRAGYMACEEGKYYIYDTKLKQIENGADQRNYYILSERTIAQEYSKYRGDKKDFSYAFFITPENILQHDYSKPFRKEVDRGRTHYKAKQNEQYLPYEIECSYQAKGKNITAVGKAGRYPLKGYAVSTGKMNEKKAIYIIPEKSESRIEVSSADIRAFQIDINKRQNTLKTFGGRKHFDLPEEGKERPVFYIHLGERLYFGFTPRLRLYYDHTIKEGVSESQKTSQMDYAKALFGFSIDQDSLKSRVSFSDAVALEGTVPMETKRLILGEPKPTSYWDYLHGGKNYNDDDFQIRGIKQYWLRNETYTNVSADQKNSDVVSQFRPLPENTKFNGKVRFHNLKKEEAGLLLWSIRLNGSSQMNIGKAKAFGYGRVSLVLNSFKVLDTNEAYQTNMLSLDPMKQGGVEEFVDAYKEVMTKQLGQDVDNAVSVAMLMAMKDPDRKPDPDTIRFMELKEYQSRSKPLQNVGEVLHDDTLSQKMKAYSDSHQKAVNGQTMKAAETKKDDGISAEIKDIKPFALFLKESDSIPDHSQVPKEKISYRNGKPEVGKQIKVRFVEDKKTKSGATLHIYEQIG